MVKIAVIGAAGQIGTPLILLCKASDLVTGHLPANGGLTKALNGADIVVVTAGIARKPGMTRDDTNASIIRDVFTEIASTCPGAISCVVTNPVNSTVPVAAEALKSARVFEATRLFGVTTLDIVRASTFAAQALGGNADQDPKRRKIPCANNPGVQFGGDEIVKSKQGAGSATTCMAYAGFRFVKTLLAARRGEAVCEEAYVCVPGVPGGKEIAAQLGVDYFAVRIQLGKGSATKALPIGVISEGGKNLLDVAIKELKVNVATGLYFLAA
ncbi:hypothetical protein BDW62DRAFT_213407 [Aspergillus aurantiobrunneus]